MEDLARPGLKSAIPPPLPTATPSGRRTAREHIGLAVLAAERAGRGALARMRRSRLLRWRYRAPAADELLLAPPDLRACDVSFLDEITSGSFGLAGSVATLNGRSPFSVAAPSPRWARALDGFGWLRHIDASPSVEGRALARRLVDQWMRLGQRKRPHAWEPEVVGRRVISWLSHAGLLLDGADRRRYAAILTSLASQVTYLSASWRDARDGHPRLVALIAIVCADLCICDHDRQLEQSQKLLASELERQIDVDGGHASRDPAVLVELLLDLLPLRQCFAARGKAPNRDLLAAIARVTAMLRHLRLGDGGLARFNGMGATERDALATVLAYDEGRPETAVRSGYVRLQRGPLVMLVDAGAVPPMELAGRTCAGCSSFELSSGFELLLANAGTPRPAHSAKLAPARATASHNTLCLGEQSSGRLVRNARLEQAIGYAPAVHPADVTCEVREAQGGDVELRVVHHGYVESFGLVHERTLALDPAGTRLKGCDRLLAAKAVVRFAWDVPFAVHFHLHPEVEASVGSSPETAELMLDNGERWRLATAGAAISIEDSEHFAGPAGNQRTAQLVLRGQCYGATEISWTLERITEGRQLGPRERRRGRAEQCLGERLAETSAGFEIPPRNRRS